MKSFIVVLCVMAMVGAAWAECPKGQELFRWGDRLECLKVPLSVDGNWEAVSDIEKKIYYGIGNLEPKTCWEYRDFTMVYECNKVVYYSTWEGIAEYMRDVWKIVPYPMDDMRKDSDSDCVYYIYKLRRPKPCE